MSYEQSITKSIWGRQLGLQQMSTSASGSGRQGQNPTFLVGAEDVRKFSTTADTTAANLLAYGQHYLGGATSSVYTLDPPIPGVHVVIATVNAVAVKTMNGETFVTSAGSSFNTMKSGGAGVMELIALTTSIWAAPDALGFTMSTTT